MSLGMRITCIYPLLLTKKRGEKVINLLLYQKYQNHFCWIKDFSRLCYDQSKHKARKFFCTRCLQPHNTEKSLSNHQEYCDNVTGLSAHMVLPEPDDDQPTLKFINHLQCLHVIYADTEALVKKIDGVKRPQTIQDTQDIACSFGYVVVRSDGVMTSQCFYRGDDAMDVSFDKLRRRKSNQDSIIQHRWTSLRIKKNCSFIQYLDANHLYGWAMSQHLPVSDFQWEKPSEKLLKKILNTRDDFSSGYIVECDLEYPHELHEEHNDYPVAPERLSVNEDMLSPYKQELVDKLNSSGVDALKPEGQDKVRSPLSKFETLHSAWTTLYQNPSCSEIYSEAVDERLHPEEH